MPACGSADIPDYLFSALRYALVACLIVAPQRGYDEPAILSYAISSFCPISADGLHTSAPSASSAAVTETCPIGHPPAKSGRRSSSQTSPAGRGGAYPNLGPWSLTRLTALTVLWDRFSPMAVILIVRGPNHPRAGEDNFNPECAEERLCPAQPASKCPAALWPARSVDALGGPSDCAWAGSITRDARS